MLKKFPWKTILFTLFAWMLFWEVKETVTGDRMFFLVRWLYYNKSFEKNIEVLTYVLTDEQVSHMFAHPNEEVHQLTKRQLQSKDVNVILRIRNLKGGCAYGRLAWNIFDSGWNVVDVNYIAEPGMPHKYTDIVIPVGRIPLERQDIPPEPILYKWKTLYLYI